MIGLVEIVTISAVTVAVLATFGKSHPAAYGCLVPFVITSAIAAYILLAKPGTSTAVLMIPLALGAAALGSVVGAVAAAGLRAWRDKRKHPMSDR